MSVNQIEVHFQGDSGASHTQLGRKISGSTLYFCNLVQPRSRFWNEGEDGGELGAVGLGRGLFMLMEPGSLEPL